MGWIISESIDYLILNLLFWCAALFVLWKRRDTLMLESGGISSFFGILLIAWTLLKSLSIHSKYDMLIEFSPFISTLGLFLIASGVKSLKQYWQELIIIFVLSIPVGTLYLVDKLIDSSTLAAKFSNFLLWYLGFQVHRQGVFVILPTGSIEIYSGCSGLNLMFLLIKLAIIFILLFRLKLSQKLLVPLIALSIAFILNGVRVTIMAILVASSNQTAFHYWHGDEGGQIFSTTAILIFGIVCQYMLKQSDNKPNNELRDQDSLEF